MTWVAITEDTVMTDTEGEDAGEVMLRLMRSHPSAVSRGRMDWIMMRPSRMERTVIALTTDPSIADRLKEDYLNYVASYTADIGFYMLEDTDIEIREVVPIDNES